MCVCVVTQSFHMHKVYVKKKDMSQWMCGCMSQYDSSLILCVYVCVCQCMYPGLGGSPCHAF